MISTIDNDTLAPVLNTLLDNHTLGTGRELFTQSKIALALSIDGEIKGGINGTLTGQNFHIALLAVSPEHRGKGYGHQLLEAIEHQARSLGATIFTLTTLDYQALAFYQAHGYTVFGRLSDCPEVGMTKYYLTK